MAQKPHPWDTHWTLGDRLGKGGQGLTHLVTRNDGPTQQAAIKILKNNQDAQARLRMRREVVSLEVLSSAGGGVPKILDHNTEEYGNPSVVLFVVMEYIPGRTLREIVDDCGPLSLELATQATLSICRTIELAHTHPILHRDLKPENIIARDLATADVVIVDYGLSFNTEDPAVTVTEETFRNRFLDLPETNTPGGNRRDPRSDVTAACAIFYYLLTGHVPGQLQGSDGRPPHLRPGFSLRETLDQKSYVGQLEVLFNRGFTPDVDNRFQTVAEFRDRISLLTTSTASTEPEDPVAVAARASAILRQKDRTTQIREFERPARELLSSLHRFAAQFASKLGRFNLNITTGNDMGQELPAGLERVCTDQLKLLLNPSHHNILRIVVYAVASRGEQCVVLRRTFGRQHAGAGITASSEYQEILWYDATTVPELRPIQSDMQEWLNGAIQELTDIVVTKGTGE